MSDLKIIYDEAPFCRRANGLSEETCPQEQSRNRIQKYFLSSPLGLPWRNSIVKEKIDMHTLN